MQGQVTKPEVREDRLKKSRGFRLKWCIEFINQVICNTILCFSVLSITAAEPVPIQQLHSLF